MARFSPGDRVVLTSKGRKKYPGTAPIGVVTKVKPGWKSGQYLPLVYVLGDGNKVHRSFPTIFWRHHTPIKTEDVIRWTKEKAKEQFEAQGGRCAICRKEISLSDHRSQDNVAHRDHCHKTGLPRALLCRSCNAGLGLFLDDVVLLRTAADYLRKFKRVFKEDYPCLVVKPRPGGFRR